MFHVMMLGVAFLEMSFIRLRKFPAISGSLLLYHEGELNFFKCFT